MAKVIANGKVQLDNGQTVSAQTGGWYDGQQYWNGSLSAPGQFNSQNNQPGQQGAAYVAPQDQAYIQQRQQTYQPQAGSQPTQNQNVSIPAGSTNTTSGTGTSNVNIPTPPTIDLVALYDQYYNASGIKDLEARLYEKDNAYLKARSTINDNPFYSEADRLGRSAKLTDAYNASRQIDQNQIATRKADIETKLNIQMKQFDINSESAKQAMDQFNNLLSIGALDNASGDSIASITRSTGLSSDMIYSAIKAQKDKNTKTQTIQYDDGENQGYAIINSDTGEIISKQNVASSKKSSSGGGTLTERQQADNYASTQNAIEDIKRGSTLRDIVNHYAVPGGLTVEEVYRLYNANSPYGAAQESLDNIKEGRFVA